MIHMTNKDCLSVNIPINLTCTSPVPHLYHPNAVSMLGQRRRRWPNIETTLGEFLMLAGTCSPPPHLEDPQHTQNVDPSPMLGQRRRRWTNIRPTYYV